MRVPDMQLNEAATAEMKAQAGALKKHLKTLSKNELINMVLELGALSAQIHEQNQFLNQTLKTLNEKVNKNESTATGSEPATAQP